MPRIISAISKDGRRVVYYHDMFSFVMLATRGAVSAVTSAGDEVRSGFADQIAGFFEYMIGRVPSWMAGFLVFVLTIFISKLAKSAVEGRIADRVDEEHQEVMVLAGRVTYFGTFALGITVALKIAGIDLTTILAAVAFGIGFALRDLIMNFIAGVMILVSRQFTIGDFIKVGATIGKVMEIQTRATILKAIDGTKVIVPNAELFTSQVTSFTTNPMRRVVVPLYISYDTNINYASKIALEVINKHPKIQKKPPPSIIVKNYGDSSIDLAARFWVGSRDGWFKVKSEIMHRMWEAFFEAGIVVPYNVLHLETNQDTAEEWKSAREKSEKHMQEMSFSAAIAEDAVKTNGAAIGAASIATQTPGVLQPAQALAIVPVTTEAPEPEGAYADQTEIDGQA